MNGYGGGRRAGRAGVSAVINEPWGKTMTLDQALDTWVTFMENSGRSGGYIEQLQYFMGGQAIRKAKWVPLVPFLKDQGLTHVGQIDAVALNGWLEHLREHLAQYSYSKAVELMKRFLRFLVEDGELTRMPIKVQTPRKPDSQIPVFTDDEIDRMHKVLRSENIRDYAMFMLMVDTGLRSNEMESLTLGQIRLERGEIELPGEKTKGKSGRILTLTESLGPLRKYLQLRPDVPTDAVFLSFYATPVYSGGNGKLTRRQTGKLPFSQGGITRKGISQAVKRWGKLADIKDARCSPHTFRHYYAVTYLRMGGDVFSLQRLLGHKKLDHTMRYATLAQIDVRARQHQFSPALRLTNGRYKRAEDSNVA